MPGTDDTGQDRRVFMRKTLDQDDTEVVALDPERVRALLAEEELAYDRRVPGSRELFARAKASLFGGVPMSDALARANSSREPGTRRS